MNLLHLPSEFERPLGFTMIELLVTLGVAAILTAIAIPSFTAIMQNDRDITQINTLVASFNYARSEAVKQNISGGLTVCPSSNGTTCAGTTNWSGGWIVWDSIAGDPPLLSMGAMVGNNTVTPTGSGSAGIAFLSNGAVAPTGGTLAIKVCDPRGAAFARDVEINSMGRIASSSTPGQTVAGAALTCP